MSVFDLKPFRFYCIGGAAGKRNKFLEIPCKKRFMVKWPRLKGYFGVTFGRLNIEKIEIKDKTKIPEKGWEGNIDKCNEIGH